jgi:hypothetical protein
VKEISSSGTWSSSDNNRQQCSDLIPMCEPDHVNRHSPDEPPIRPSSTSIVQELIEKCEVVHT